jgi:hypothetical protein
MQNSSSPMIICTKCGHRNRVGTLFCEDCGVSLENGGTLTIPTRAIHGDPDEASARATWGAARIGANTQIILHIRDFAQPLVFVPTQRMICGRSDAQTTTKPDIDFANYSGLEKGVSRQHAVLEFNEDTLMLIDAGSANGTFLNGQRLSPNQPRVVRDGDEVRLGKLIAHIYFK